jgi:hypothetical protein
MSFFVINPCTNNSYIIKIAWKLKKNSCHPYYKHDTQNPLRFSPRKMINTEKSKPHKLLEQLQTLQCCAFAPIVQGCPEVLRIRDHLGTKESRAEALKTTGLRQKLAPLRKNSLAN